MARNDMIFARISQNEREMFDAIRQVEKLSSVSATVRYLIRLGARVYGYLPTIDCPNCESQKVEQTADDLMVCSKCGQEFGK